MIEDDCKLTKEEEEEKLSTWLLLGEHSIKDYEKLTEEKKK